jgi:hypothetical protein
MRTAAIPSVRVEPALRDQLEQVLHEGESLSSFVEASVRANVRRRLDQAEFLQRGLVSLADTRQSDQYVGVDDVLRKLEARLDEAKRAKPANRQGT